MINTKLTTLEYIDKANRSKYAFDRIEDLQHAMDLYNGPLFDGKAESTEMLYDMDILGSAYLEASEQFLRLLMDVGWHTKAITYASRGLCFEHSYPFYYAIKFAAQKLAYQHNAAQITMAYAKQALDKDEMNYMVKIIHDYLPEWNFEDQADDLQQHG